MVGQSTGMRGGGRLSSAIPAISEAPSSNIRMNVVCLLTNGYQHRRLSWLGDVCARLYNEVNYERRQQFFNGQQVDFVGTYRRYYERYRDILGVNAQAIVQKNNEAWASFFSQLKAMKEGRLPPFIKKISPPGYWKDREGGRRKIIVIRQDRYVVDVERRKLILKDFNIEIDFVGEIRWYGKQGRLEIIYDEAVNRWYAHIPVEVGVETTKRGNRARHIVRGERKSIQIASPKGDRVASIDLGINVMASVVVDDGTWLLYKGVRAKQDYFYLEKRIAEIQSLEAIARNIGELDAAEELRRERRRLFRKLYRRLTHLYRTLASHLVKTLHDLGVSTIYIGYPYNISQDNGNKYSVNIWSYHRLIQTIELEAQEYGMRVYEVIEYGTSSRCAYHNVDVKRKPRGVVTCPLGHRMHSDLNGALNIMKIATGKIVEHVKKPLSYIVHHNGVAPAKGGNARDPSETSPFRAGKGS
ncbi:MAG: transposase [Sulfolobales archaeon]